MGFKKPFLMKGIRDYTEGLAKNPTCLNDTHCKTLNDVDSVTRSEVLHLDIGKCRYR
jgi:hypothetical protein